MHVITQISVLFLWIHILTVVKSKDCTRAQFLNSDLYDSNFDITSMEESYSGGTRLRVNCIVGHSGFFKLSCIEGQWEPSGSKCQPRSCGHPGDAQYADFHLAKGEDFVFGSIVEYTCHKGYQMVSRVNKRHCMANGWDGVVPICEAQHCPVINVDDNVLVNGDPEDATYGNVVRFSCKNRNEIMIGSTEMYCDENGDWNGQRPICKEIECNVPVVVNGYMTDSKTKYKENEFLYYECDPQYKKFSIPSKCIKVGTSAEFSPTPQCQEVRCTLPSRPVTGTSYDPTYKTVYKPGETVRVICSERYWVLFTKESESVSTCNGDGEWEPMTTCQRITCRNQRPPHVTYWNVRWGDVIELGQEVSYNCRDGYKKTSEYATCTRDEWDPKQFCEEITCNRKEIENTDIVDVRGYTQTYKYRQTATYRCKNGYTGRFTLTCGQYGWHGQSSCTEEGCDKMDIKDAHISYNNRRHYSHNEQVQYTCTSDRQKTFLVTCVRGKWTGVQSCGEEGCDKMDIKDAHISYNNRRHYSHNEQVQYTCTSDRQQTFLVTCVRGKWTGVQSCGGCAKPTVPNGFAIVQDDDKLYFACNDGFKLSTKGWWGEAKCVDQRWYGTQTCIENTSCGEPPKIKNGEVKPVGRQSPQKARITCKEGYHAQVPNLICRDGNWDSSGYSPKEICKTDHSHCKAPPRVENAVILTSYQEEYLSDSAVIYHCRDGFKMEGERRIQCKDGQWEETNIKCAHPTTSPEPTESTVLTMAKEPKTSTVEQ